MNRSRRQPFFTTESMRYFHQVIIHNHSKVVSRHTISFQKHFIVNKISIEANLTTDHISKCYCFIFRHFNANHMRNTLLN
ncbi:hypothetical protein D3C80_1246770 [compost metagenome]